MITLLSYAKAQGATKLDKVNGPNGAFISMTKGVDSEGKPVVSTIPVGKRSQSGKLGEYNVLITDDGQAIATVNHYETVESITLND